MGKSLYRPDPSGASFGGEISCTRDFGAMTNQIIKIRREKGASRGHLARRIELTHFLFRSFCPCGSIGVERFGIFNSHSLDPKKRGRVTW